MSKKSLGLVLLAVAFFGFVITVSAAATTAILDYNASVQLTENNLDSSFLTRINSYKQSLFELLGLSPLLAT